MEASAAVYFRVVLSVCLLGTVSLADCSVGWVGFGNFCYKFVEWPTKNWTSARADCLGYGGDLISIHSAEEEAFIRRFYQWNFYNSFWCGLNDRTTENIYEWSDKTSVIYTSSFIARTYDSKDCVRIVVYHSHIVIWYTSNCGYTYEYICKRRKDCKVQAIETSSSALFPDNRWTASSSKSGNEPYKARLNGAGAWAPATNAGADYLQIDLGAVYVICAVATQGNPNEDEWTKTYKISLSVNKVYWTDHDNGTSGKVFIGNANRNSTVKQSFVELIQARFVRFVPVDYNGEKALRVEIYGVHKGVLASPTDLRVTNIQSRTVTVQWTNPDDDSALGSASLNKIQYSSGDNTWNITTQSLTTSQSLSGLVPYTKYKVKVLVTNNNTQGLWSAGESFTTDLDVPEEAPILTATITLTSQSIQVNWQTPDKINGALIGYKVLYKKKGPSSFIIKTLVGSTTSHTLSFLEEMTEYEVKVKVYNSKGDSPASDVKTVRTLEDASPPSKSPPNQGVVIGLVTLVVVGIILLVLVVLVITLAYLIFKMKRNRPSNTEQAETRTSNETQHNPDNTRMYMDLQSATQTYETLGNSTQRRPNGNCEDISMSYLNVGCQQYEEVLPSRA